MRNKILECKNDIGSLSVNDVITEGSFISPLIGDIVPSTLGVPIIL
jgi:hypothetical protein